MAKEVEKHNNKITPPKKKMGSFGLNWHVQMQNGLGGISL